MRRTRSARFLAGALFMSAIAGALAGAEPIRIAANRADVGTCPGKVLCLLLPGQTTERQIGGRYVALIRVSDLAEGTLDSAAAEAAKLPPVFAVILQLEPPAEPENSEWTSRLAYAVKRLSSAVRGASPDAKVGYGLTHGFPAGRKLTLPELDLGPYIDAFVRSPASGSVEESDVTAQWLMVTRPASETSAGVLLRALTGLERDSTPELLAVLDPTAAGPRPSDWESLERLQAYWNADVSRDPTVTKATRPNGTTFEALRFFDAKKFTPILLLPQDAAGRIAIDLAGGPFSKASVENLGSGTKRDFDVRGAKTLTLDLSQGALAVVLQPATRAGETRTTLEIGTQRGLTAEEIVARERAWDAGQREKITSFIADLKTSLRFRIGEVNETFDLTILGPLFFQRGGPSDWEWDEFYLNGVKWKSKTLPKLPILQPEKVTTLPLDIRLSEDYDYHLKGESTITGRRVYEITFTPRSTVGEKAIYRGTVWIDKERFALLRRDSVQLNLKGETLSNIQTEFYRPVPGRPDVLLPLEIKGEQVFSTAGRTTAIERDVVMTAVRLNPAEFEEKRAAAYRSPAQMIRDTERGMRYLVPDAAQPGQRIVEEKVSKKSTFGLAGMFYDDSLSYPIPLLGIQYFNFDLWGKGKQLSVFFGGALLTVNYTDPSLAGSRFDLGADLFGVAFAFGDTSYRNGKEVPAEKVKHLPAVFQANVGHPLGPYLKASVGLFTKWDNYQRDKDTGPAFVVPVDTFTDGAELKLVGNISGFNAVATGGYFRRRRWEPWGDPATSEYDPKQKEYWKYSFSLSKDQYFSGFRKLHMGIAYLGGADLDRFSKYEFGTFSGNPIRGFKSGSLRTEKAIVGNLSYGINFEDIIRFEGFYDQALVTDRRSGFDKTYFSGAGLLASLNGPWKNSLVRGEVGVPVVSHGVRGFVINVILLKLF